VNRSSPENQESGTVPATSLPVPDDLLLLDGAGPGEVGLGPEMDREKAVASDPGRSIQDRLEAYENILESEVGDTLLYRARNIERRVGLRQIYLKFEGDNPSGTQKDRIAFSQVLDALRRGFDSITVATCGNYGVAMALAASLGGLRCLVYIPAGYHTKRIQEMESYGAEVVRAPGDYESVVLASRARAAAEELYDANAGGANTAIQLRSYGEIANEIYDELRDAPTAVAAPVSNGTTLAGIYKGFASLNRRGKTSHVPRMVAGSSFGKNPIVESFRKNLPRCEDLAPTRIRETAVNEPLVNWSSLDGDHALDAVRQTSGWAAFASDRSMQEYAKLLREQQGLSVLPASTAGLIALLDRHRREPLPPGRYVVILTGRTA